MAAVEALTSRRPWPRVEEPELRRSIVELGHGPGRGRRRRKRGHGRPGACPSRATTPAPSCGGGCSTPSARCRASTGSTSTSATWTRTSCVALGRRPEGRQPPPTRCRCSTPSAAPRSARAARQPVHRHPHPCARHRVGQGRRGQVVGHHQPLHRARQRGQRVAAVDADVWGFSMPRMLGISSAARAHRRRDRAARGLRRPADLDGLLRPRGPGRDLARPDVAQGARAVPHRRLLGRDSTTSSSTCRPAPATSRCRSRSSSRAPR